MAYKTGIFQTKSICYKHILYSLHTDAIMFEKFKIVFSFEFSRFEVLYNSKKNVDVVADVALLKKATFMAISQRFDSTSFIIIVEK